MSNWFKIKKAGLIIGLFNKLNLIEGAGVSIDIEKNVLTKQIDITITAPGTPYDGDPTVIDQDATHRFVSDAEKTTWNAKLAPNGDGSALTGITKAQVGLSNVDNTSDVNKPVSTAQALAINQVLLDLRDGVAGAGDTLQKLYNIIIGQTKEITVATIAARNAYNIPALPVNVFVTDDGDGNWALYKATTTGVGATFVKLSDPDLLNAVLSASQIKVSYESNPDTNAFTNALKAVVVATSGTNTGDNATNTQYSGLATSKQDVNGKLTDLSALSYIGNALKTLRVNASETGWELVVASGSSDIALTAMAPSLDQTITAGNSAYVSGFYEIADTKFLEIGAGSVFEIGN